MKIYNEEKTQVLENPDLKKGWLKQDKIVIKTIPATEEIKEQFHYEYKDYFDENGNLFGQDRIKVVDVAYEPAKPENYEYEDIQVYILFTEEELKENRKVEIQTRLNELNQDFVQVLAGAVIDDIEERRKEFQTLHNELRTLLGKEPRIYS